MSGNYYYLVAGLPDLVLDENKNVPDFAEFVADLSEQMEPADVALLTFLRRPYDNCNLAALLEERDEPFDTRGNFTQEELTEEIKAPERLPAYAEQFLESRNEGKEPFQGYTVHDQLTWLFMDVAREHDNEFVREWFGFECDLRNLITAANLRSQFEASGGDYRVALNTALVCRTDVVDQIMRSSAPDFSVGTMLPWAEKVLSASTEDLVSRERTIDDLRWSVLNELTTFSYFQTETILAFCIKLAMVHRWMLLDAAEGKKRFEQLVEEMRTGAEAPVE